MNKGFGEQGQVGGVWGVSGVWRGGNTYLLNTTFYLIPGIPTRSR